MGGFFGVASKEDCIFNLFYGVDYHSHLGTKKGGIVVYGENGYRRSIHNIENSLFRSKFEGDIEKLHGNIGIGCISDNESQPLIISSHLGTYAITTVGLISNLTELVKNATTKNSNHFSEFSSGEINPTELVASLINQRETIVEGIKYAQQMIEGSISILLMTPEGIYAARDRLGRTPIAIGKKDGSYCASFECFSYLNLGYRDHKELGAAEIVYLTPESCETVAPAQKDTRICSFLWVYYGYPTSSYEGESVEEMRYRSGELMSKRDNILADSVSGVPDSGIAYAVGYANASNIPFARPFIKYTPTWPRSFMSQMQVQRELIAKMKLLPIDVLIRGKKLLIIEDSIVRGTQARETANFLYQCGANEVHVRIACPPVMFKCKYLNFSRSSTKMELITRSIISKYNTNNASDNIQDYLSPDGEGYNRMVSDICRELDFTSLQFQRLDDMIASIGVNPCKLCTYCWDGNE